MAQQMAEVAATGATVAVVATTVAVPLIKRLANGIAYKYNKYGEEQIREIKAIKLAYKDFCWPTEKDSSLTTITIFTLDQENVEVKRQSKEYPIYFITENNDEIPALFSCGFAPCTDQQRWLGLLDKNSILRSDIEDIIGYICNYQNQRNARIIGKGYNYDPTNLFFEEFNTWLISLSKSAKIDNQVYKAVNQRIKYLGELYARVIFKPGDDSPTRLEILKKIRDMLKNGILVTIKLAISRESSRDHFQQLREIIKNNIKIGVKFLFYVFRDTEKTPSSFILQEVTNPTDIVYKTIITKTRSGELLNYLMNTDVMRSIFPIVDKSLTKTIDKRNFENNSFIDESGALVYPLTKASIHIYNWFELDAESDSDFNPIGILKEFRNNKEAMKRFIKLHGQLQKLCMFYLICDQLYDISGFGGDIMVYGYALSLIRSILGAYRDLAKDMADNYCYLYEMADTYKATLIKSSSIKNKKVGVWNDCFYFTYRAYDEVESGIAEAEDAITKIESRAIELNSQKYQDQIREKIKELCSWAKCFTGNKESGPNFSVPSIMSQNQGFFGNRPATQMLTGKSATQAFNVKLENYTDEQLNEILNNIKQLATSNSELTLKEIHDVKVKYLAISDLYDLPSVKDQNRLKILLEIKIQFASLLVRSKKINKAVLTLAEVLRFLDPNKMNSVWKPVYIKTLARKAVILKESNDLEEAKKDIEELLSLEPNHPNAKKILQEITQVKTQAFEVIHRP